MDTTITLTLPERLLAPIQRMAQATDQPVESILLTALQASLPPLDGLPEHLTQALVELETLDTAALQNVLRETVPAKHQREIVRLLHKNQSNALTESEQKHLTLLQNDADTIMLRKARAAVLLRFRGQRIPTLAELQPGASAIK